MLPKGQSKNGQSRETDNKTQKNETKQKHNMHWTPLC